MKSKITTAFIVLLFINCSKENTSNRAYTTFQSSDAVAVNTAKIPLNDLGTGTYRDSVGGLYPNGANTPSGTYAADLLKVSKTIIPLDTFGKVSSTGYTVFISLGGSTGGKNMEALQNKTKGNPLTNPRLKLLRANSGARRSTLNSIMNPNDPYWDHITQIIKGSRSSYRQVQVIYLETNDSVRIETWPEKSNSAKIALESSMRTLKQRFKNLKVIYVLGLTQSFSGNPGIREPAPYFFGWSCKWAIQDQINGVPGTEYKGSNAVAPIITWGFYQWANSTPRTTDNFYWRVTETADGLHANPIGQDTLSKRFQNFLLTDSNASLWYAKH
jgi:hypothetical protein